MTGAVTVNDAPPRGLPVAQVVAVRYSADQLEGCRRELTLMAREPVPDPGPTITPGVILAYWVDPKANQLRVAISTDDWIARIHERIPPNAVSIVVDPGASAWGYDQWRRAAFESATRRRIAA